MVGGGVDSAIRLAGDDPQFDQAAEHVQGAKHIALADLGTRLAAEVKNKATPVIFVCAKGNASRRATLVAKQQGFEQAQSLAGGYKAWVDAGLPIAKAANVTKAA